jgi:cytochrome c5
MPDESHSLLPRFIRKRGVLLAAGAAVVAAASIALTAPGIGAATSSATKTTVKSSSTKAATGSSGAKGATAYTACLKAHGISLPSFRPGQGRPAAGATGPRGASGRRFFGPSGLSGANAKKFQSAAAACAKYRPKGGFGFGNGAGFRFGNAQASAAYRNCLALNGFKLPTPGAKGATGINFNSSKVQKALKACAALRPKTPSGASGHRSV